MGFKEKLTQKLQDAYWEKYKDRITQIHGHVLSVKITEKVILGFIHLFLLKFFNVYSNRN